MARLPLYKIMQLDIDDIMKMTKKELLPIVKTIGKSANYRAKQVKRYDTPAYRLFEDSGGKIDVYGKTPLSQLRKDFKRGTKFLKSKTSTVKGYKELQNKLYGQFGNKLTDEDKSKIWEIYRKIEEGDYVGNKMYGSSETLKDIITLYNMGKNDEEIIENMFLKLQDNYEESELPWDEFEDNPFD